MASPKIASPKIASPKMASPKVEKSPEERVVDKKSPMNEAKIEQQQEVVFQDGLEKDASPAEQ